MTGNKNTNNVILQKIKIYIYKRNSSKYSREKDGKNIRVQNVEEIGNVVAVEMKNIQTKAKQQKKMKKLLIVTNKWLVWQKGLDKGTEADTVKDGYNSNVKGEQERKQYKNTLRNRDIFVIRAKSTKKTKNI